MYALARPLLFSVGPHAAHALAHAALAPLEAFPRRVTLDPALGTRALGLVFPSVLGLAGGFDKDARRPLALASLGFGFLELGTVTAQGQRENPRPNLFRLPADHALINRLGFPNDGAREVAGRIAAKRARVSGLGVPIFVSIGKSRAVPLDPIEGAIADYVASLRAVKDVCDAIVVNVSSPNTKDLRAMQGADVARALLDALTKDTSLPILIKIAPDLGDAELEALLEVVERAKIAGVVATNTTVRRDGLRTSANAIGSIGAGGLSGPPLRARALEVVRRARARLGKSLTVVGVGGIETGEDLVAFLRAGADLAQIYTAFVYRGPRAPVLIANEALAIARREGARTLAELVGS